IRTTRRADGTVKGMEDDSKCVRNSSHKEKRSRIRLMEKEDEEDRRRNGKESFPMIVIDLYLAKETERVRSKVSSYFFIIMDFVETWLIKDLSMLIPVKKTMEETDEVKTKTYYDEHRTSAVEISMGFSETIANRLEQQGGRNGVVSYDSNRTMSSERDRKERSKIKRKEKEAKKASLAVDSVFGKEDSSSDSSSSKSSKSSFPSSSPNKEDLAAKRLVQCLEELKLARLSRFKLARFIAQVIDMVEAAKVITWSQRKLINNQEFQEWMSTMKTHNRSLPTMGEIHKKMKDIASPGEHNYTNDEVNQLAESLRGEMAREMEGISEQARVLHRRPPTTTTIEKE
ncbi:hypothetical protein PRIPAC_78899, partial [Pristionchus pacificus]|uniref:Uncharacterized protein n=1 Tax=Pristionchus pacificus TaxID=54126 RepID=A0A2A6BYQ4_PRIPA